MRLFLFGGSYEVTDPGASETVTKYYSIGGMRIAMRDSTGTYYFAADHLSSTSLVMEDDSNVIGEQRYMPFGELREGVGTLLEDTADGFTDFGYTNQRNYANMGLMDYHARFYSPTLGRFTQPDSVIPDLTNSQAWNRYSYVNNSPILYVDPSGRMGKPSNNNTPCMDGICEIGSPGVDAGTGGGNEDSGEDGDLEGDLGEPDLELPWCEGYEGEGDCLLSQITFTAHDLGHLINQLWTLLTIEAVGGLFFNAAIAGTVNPVLGVLLEAINLYDVNDLAGVIAEFQDAENYAYDNGGTVTISFIEVGEFDELGFLPSEVNQFIGDATIGIQFGPYAMYVATGPVSNLATWMVSTGILPIQYPWE